MRSWGKVFRWALAIAILIVMIVPVGVANLVLGFLHGESPCILCGNERFGMVLVAALGVFMLRFGPRWKYVVMMFLVAGYYLYATVRHWGGRADADLGQGFGDAILGVHTYTWGIIVYWVVVIAMGVGLVFILKDPLLTKQFTARGEPEPLRLTKLSATVMGVVMVLTSTNAVQFFIGNGIPPYAGAGDPARFSFNIARTSRYWDREHQYESLSDIRLHKFTAPEPKLPGNGYGVDHQPGQPLAETARHQLGFPVTGFDGKGSAAGISYDPANHQYGVVSSDGGIYFTKDFKTATSQAIMDKPNGSDIADTVDAACLEPGNVTAMAKNKTVYGAVRPGANQANGDQVDSYIAEKDFTQSTGDLMPAFGSKKRPELHTQRARIAYALTLASDPSPQAKSYVVVSAPHERSKDVVVSEFSKKDHKLVREGVIEGSPYPVGGDLRDGKLYLITDTQAVAVVDMATLAIERTVPLPPMGDAHDVAVAASGHSLAVLSRDGDQDVVHEVAMP